MSSDKKPNVHSMVNGLIGQANLEHARGRSKEALSLLQEAIRQAPRCVEVYNQISDVYADLKQNDKSFEYKLLAAHMSSRTTAPDWAAVGDFALSLDRLEEAATCFDKAVRNEPTNWTYYEKRIEVLDTMCLDETSMKVRLQAAKMIDCRLSNVSFNFIQDLIKMVAEYYIGQNDEDKAMDALETFILRSREFGRSADAQHLTLLGMWMARDRFKDCVKSILALQPGIEAQAADKSPVFKIEYSTNSYTLEPFPPTQIDEWVVKDCFQTQFLARLIVNLIRSGLKAFAPKLIDELLDRPVVLEEENCFLEVGRAYQLIDCTKLGVKYMEVLLQMESFQKNPDAWFLFGIFQQARGDIEKARDAYERVIKIQPTYVDARINLSTILQTLDKSDEALATLMDYDLESCSLLPDERLLLRQAEVLFQQKRMHEYAKCVRLILIPYFYLVNQIMLNDIKVRQPKMGINFTLMKKAFEALRGSALERTVKRLGAVNMTIEDRSSLDRLNGIQLHDFALHLAEHLFNEGEHLEMLHVVCYAFLQPKICATGQTTFKNLLFFASIKGENYSLAFEFLRFHYLHLMNHSPDLQRTAVGGNTNGPSISSGGGAATADESALSAMASLKNAFGEESSHLLFCRVFNAMNFVFCHRQNVCYHRFVMRALAKTPENYPLHMISGNNSLITGSYRHALGEYFRVWLNNRDDPLVCLLIGLTFTHMACKKDISSRHMVAARGLAFMKRYQKLRGKCQEVDYNLGRMFHQLGILGTAIYFYERVLHESEVPKVHQSDQNDIFGGANEDEVEDGRDDFEMYNEAERYDLKRLAAHNLALIYESSGNRMLAREILEDYCTI